MLAKQCAAACGVVMDTTADVVIANAYPRDYDLWQSFKSIPNTAAAARPNGVIIVLAACPVGSNMPPISWPLSPNWTRKLIKTFGAGNLISLANRFVKTISPRPSSSFNWPCKPSAATRC